jgi:SRSO17 transposase
MAYLRGLLSTVERKNSWQLAEVVGAANPYGFQHLHGRADWNADALRDELHDSIVEHLGDPDAAVVHGFSTIFQYESFRITLPSRNS